LKALFEENTDDLEKLTILKSMGNLGTSELFAILKTIVEDHKMTRTIRLNAIYALRRVAKTSRKQVLIVETHLLCWWVAYCNVSISSSQLCDIRAWHLCSSYELDLTVGLCQCVKGRLIHVNLLLLYQFFYRCQIIYCTVAEIQGCERLAQCCSAIAFIYLDGRANNK